jgi:hypothetical protein
VAIIATTILKKRQDTGVSVANFAELQRLPEPNVKGTFRPVDSAARILPSRLAKKRAADLRSREFICRLP